MGITLFKTDANFENFELVKYSSSATNNTKKSPCN